MLIDGGSTHNFIQDKVVRFLNLKAQPTKQLNVMVGNGSELLCTSVCRGIQVHIQNQVFVVDLYVMTIAGRGGQKPVTRPNPYKPTAVLMKRVDPVG